MKVSACIITFNHEKYITECLENAVKQIISCDYEIVIGDDNSTDRTGEICQEYAENYPKLIKYYRRKRNVGMVENWFSTLKACSGDFIAICEGDDFWSDNLKLHKQMQILRKHSDVGLCHTGSARFYQEYGRLIKYTRSNITLNNANFDKLLFTNPIRTCTVMFRSSFILDYLSFTGENRKRWKMADAPLWLFISLSSKLYFLNQETSIYRILKNSATNVSAYKKLLFRLSRYRVSWFFLSRNFSLILFSNLLFKFFKEVPVLILKSILSAIKLYKPNKLKVIKKYE